MRVPFSCPQILWRRFLAPIPHLLPRCSLGSGSECRRIRCVNNSLRQQRFIHFRRGASGLVGLKLRKGGRSSCGVFFIEDIVPGGAAAFSGGFNVGDMVHAVNEHQVFLENVQGVLLFLSSL